jgi:methylaspartate ammonia-lyase
LGVVVEVVVDESCEGSGATVAFAEDHGSTVVIIASPSATSQSRRVRSPGECGTWGTYFGHYVIWNS